MFPRVQFNRSVCFLLVATVLLYPLQVLAESSLVDRPKRELFSIVSIRELTSEDRELADQLEISPLLTELYDQQHKPTSARKAILREKILETILECYFDAQSVSAEAEREQGRLETLRQTLLSQRDRRVEINNATNFITAGTLNTIGSILGFSPTAPPLPGNLNQMLSGVVSATMSMYALKQNAGGKTRGQGSSTILAELFGRPTDERTQYPESVWRFFHGKSFENPALTRVQALENYWIATGELKPHGSRKEVLKLDLVSGVTKARKAMTIDDLTDQIKMISDVSNVADLMAHHLRDLLRVIDSDVLE